MTLNKLSRAALLAAFSVVLVACAKDTMKPETASTAEKPMAEAQEAMISELYEAHHNGRIYVFYDRGLYEGFKKTGHTAYMMARIGGGPKGETIKFALTGKDNKKREGIPSVDLFDGKLKASDSFYGEVYAEGLSTYSVATQRWRTSVRLAKHPCVTLKLVRARKARPLFTS